MHPDSIPERPLRAVIGKLEVAQRVYFFEREDGSIIFTQGREAFNLIKHPPQVLGEQTKRLKFIGSSEGAIYREAVKKAHKLFSEKGQAELPACQKFLRDAQDEELKLARGNMIPPPNFETIDRQGRPTNIMNVQGIQL